MAAQTITSCFPDYRQAPPEYLVRLTEALQAFDEETLVQLCDLEFGIPSKCKFLPTISEIVDEGHSFERRRATERHYELLQQSPRMSMDEYHAQRTGERSGYRPFPRLWEAFAGDAEARAKLNGGVPFDRLFDASRLLATTGMDAARKLLIGEQKP